jgi:DNA polymerase-2
LKACLGNLENWDPRRAVYKARASAHNWLLVTCFGYLGYRNARFGRIEAHEAVTAYGREALLRAKEVCEDFGFTVLHMYVDGLWVKPEADGAITRPAEYEPLLAAITEHTHLPISLDGIFRWVAFLPSRQDGRVPVPNRYFGVFQDGSLKVRGIEVRRHDTPPFIAQTQKDMLEILAQAPMYRLCAPTCRERTTTCSSGCRRCAGEPCRCRSCSPA